MGFKLTLLSPWSARGFFEPVELRQTGLERILDERRRKLRTESRIEATLATCPDGKQWKRDHYKHRFADIRAELGLQEDLHFHGLRHTSLSLLAETGATGPEIQAIGGHKELSSLERYIAQASQANLAASGIAKLGGRANKAKPRTRVTSHKSRSD